MLLGGALVAYIEFLRPGWVAPAVIGGVVAMVGFARLATFGFYAEGVALFLAGAALIVFEAWLWPRFRAWFLIAGPGVLVMSWGAAHLVRLPAQINAEAAEAAVLLFAIVTVPLLSTAFRARRNKRTLRSEKRTDFSVVGAP
jgi:membrane-bound ClpP family serine protease